MDPYLRKALQNFLARQALTCCCIRLCSSELKHVLLAMQAPSCCCAQIWLDAADPAMSAGTQQTSCRQRRAWTASSGSASTMWRSGTSCATSRRPRSASWWPLRALSRAPARRVLRQCPWARCMAGPTAAGSACCTAGSCDTARRRCMLVRCMHRSSPLSQRMSA